MEKELSGKPVAQNIYTQIKEFLLNTTKKPTMALLQAGNDPAAEYYVQSIMKQADKIGCEVICPCLPNDITQKDFLDVLRSFNEDKKIDGIMIQKPLPSQINETTINLSINPEKDIDGIHPLNLGKLFMELSSYIPCTAAAVIEMMKFYDIKPIGKRIVIIGRSVVVGKPLAALLLKKDLWGNATVTICHSYSTNLVDITKSADIIVTAIGKPFFLKANMIKEGSILIDVGINAVHDKVKGEIYVGDIDYNDCFAKALAITPVPGGIGSITTSLLFHNLMKASRRDVRVKSN